MECGYRLSKATIKNMFAVINYITSFIAKNVIVEYAIRNINIPVHSYMDYKNQTDYFYITTASKTCFQITQV